MRTENNEDLRNFYKKTWLYLVFIKMKKILSIALLFAIGLIIGIIVTMIWYAYHTSSNPQGHLQDWHHVFSMIGSIGTVAAVVVALFKDEIMSTLFHPKIVVEKNDEGDNTGLIEVKDQNEGTLKVKYYECCVRISNTGNRPTNECEVKLIGVKYCTYNGKWKELMKDSKHVDWSYTEDVATLLTDDCKRLPLFRIFPDNSEGTPDNKMRSSKRIHLFGFTMENKFQRKGHWIFSYKISSSKKEYCKFDVDVDWTGTWCERINEMKDEITIKLEQK